MAEVNEKSEPISPLPKIPLWYKNLSLIIDSRPNRNATNSNVYKALKFNLDHGSKILTPSQT